MRVNSHFASPNSKKLLYHRYTAKTIGYAPREQVARANPVGTAQVVENWQTV